VIEKLGHFIPLGNDEPDYKAWKEGNYPCLALRQEISGTWCGYVGIKEDHPLYAKAKKVQFLSAHGGITYHEFNQYRDSFFGDEKGFFWIGFDCMHSGDLTLKRYSYVTQSLDDVYDVYRDLSYVESEILSLVRQLVKHETVKSS
jgi:hypothetical protein